MQFARVLGNLYHLKIFKSKLLIFSLIYFSFSHVFPSTVCAQALTEYPISDIAKEIGIEESDSSSEKGAPTLQNIQSQKPNYVPGEVIIKYKKDKINLEKTFGLLEANFFEARHSLEKIEELKNMNMRVLKSDKSTEELIRELESNKDIEYIQPNYIYELSAISTNDTYRNYLWGLDNTGQTLDGVAGTNDADIDAPAGWTLSEGSSSVIVAVIDTGVAYNHPDLLANMWNGSSCLSDTGAALGNCNHGYDYEDNDTTPLPTESSHGTHVAGTIASVKNNSKGIIGVAPSTKIMAIKTSLTSADNIKSINFAQQNGADVINASWGGSSYDSALEDAIEDFTGLFIAAAGNGGSDGIGDNNDSVHNYPSDFTLANIISVAATDQNDGLASFSNYGATSVDLGAPGVNIYSTEGYRTLDENFQSVTVPSIGTKFTQTGSNTWGTLLGNDSVSKAIFGDYAYWGNYRNNITSSLYSPSINLTGKPDSYLNFSIYCNSEAGYDGVTLAFWSGSSWVTQQTYSGIGYLSESFPLQSYTISNFRIRFTWSTDESNPIQYYGCYIDDIKVIDSVSTSESYQYMDGTSMAAPHVAGGAALLFAENSSLTPAQVKALLLNYGDSKSALSGKTVSGKRMNVYTSLLNSTTPTQPIIHPNSATQFGPVYVSLDSTNETSIRYTTNGSTPTCSSGSVYSAPFLVTPEITVNAIACTTYLSSSVATISYTSTDAITTSYLAEGSTSGFSTYVLIQNPNSYAAAVTATYYLSSGGNLSKSYSVPANSRYTLVLNSEVGTGKAVSTKIESNQEVIVERAMYWDAGGVHWAGGHNTMGTSTLGQTWYLAEGSTGGFYTYILIQNPNSSAADITATYMLTGEDSIVKTYSVPANSRYTLVLNNEVGPGKAVSTKIESTQDIVVERAMYWDAGGAHWAGGHNTMGATTLGQTWYLAEGSTSGFSTYVLIQNPNDSAATVTATYMLTGQANIVKTHTVPANSRYTINVNNEIGNGKAVSTMIESTQDVVVERAMYWNAGGVHWTGGHNTMGTTQFRPTWYLAEGSTSGFSAYVLIQNPNEDAANITATYMLSSGSNIVKTHTVPANSRYTIVLSNEVGIGKAVSTMIESDQNVIVERSMYWDAGGVHWAGGHNTMGQPRSLR